MRQNRPGGADGDWLARGMTVPESASSRLPCPASDYLLLASDSLARPRSYEVQLDTV